MLYALAAWAAAVAGLDLAHRRIPNAALLALLIPAVLALVVNGEGLLQQDWTLTAGGFALALGFTLPGHVVGALGAGDVKFAAVLGGLLGLRFAALWLLAAALLLGLCALASWSLARWNRRAPARFPAAPALASAFCLLLPAVVQAGAP